MTTKEGMTFAIKGNDFRILKKFHKQHEDCNKGMACEQYSYTFIPTGLGLAITVKCSCGQTLRLGDFMDYEVEEYDEDEYRVLTEEDVKNKAFEDAVICILQLKDPRIFRMVLGQKQDFNSIYAASYGMAIAGDKRISKCLLPLENAYSKDENFMGLNDAEKIKKFYNQFENNLKKELLEYGCQNKMLLDMLAGK